jgi:leucyl aminopeptidase
MKSSTIEFSIKNDKPEKQVSNCLIVGVYESQKLSAAALAINAASSDYIINILKRGDMEGKLDTTLMLHNVPGTLSERVLLIGLGKEAEFTEVQYCKAVRASVKALAGSGAREACTYLAELPVKQLGARWKIAHMTEVTLDATYQFDAIKRKKE